MATQFTVSTIDRLANPTSTTIGVDAAITDPQAQAVVDAWDALILGAASKGVKTVATVVDGGSQVPPSNVDANRKLKWLYRVQDDTTGIVYPHEYGTADNAQLASPTSDFIDLTAGAGLALKTAIDTAYRSPDGNAGTLLSVQQIHRSGN